MAAMRGRPRKVKSADSKNKSEGRYAKNGECWITIRIPQDIKEVISAIAANSDRSESYVARCLVLSRLNQLLNKQTEDYADRLDVPELFIEDAPIEDPGY